MNGKGKKVAFTTLGCKLNFAETSAIAARMETEGYERVPFRAGADIYVINTCSVTQAADKKCRQAIRKAVHFSPQATIVVTGCYSQLKAKEIAAIEGVDIVLGTREKFLIPGYLERYEQTQKAITETDVIAQVKEYAPAFSLHDRTRAFLKVQDGCDYFCSYCTVPLARGCSRNESVHNTAQYAVQLAKQNIKEIVLTGVNIGDFGKSTGETFLNLLQALEETEGIERFRISSIEPNLLTEEIIEFIARSCRFVPHFHMPLQSGNNEILGKMHRRYRRELFAERVKTIRNRMPAACIGADVITGFPGETDVLFEDTYTFLEALDISYLHSFPFSERKNTEAVKLPGKVDPAIKEKRTHRLIELSKQKRNLFYQHNIGTQHHVLFEAAKKQGLMSGFTENYIRVEYPYNKSLVNQIVNMQLTGIQGSENMTGTLI